MGRRLENLTDRTYGADVTDGTDWRDGTCGTDVTDGTGDTYGTSVTNGTHETSGTDETHGTDWTGGTNMTYGTYVTGGADGTYGAVGTYGTYMTYGTCRNILDRQGDGTYGIRKQWIRVILFELCAPKRRSQNGRGFNWWGSSAQSSICGCGACGMGRESDFMTRSIDFCAGADEFLHVGAAWGGMADSV